MEKRNFQKRYKPKLSQRYQDVPKLEKRIQEETPPADIYYYKYFEDEEKQADDKSKQKQVEIEEQVGLKKFIKTNDPKKVKIRFEHLPISKYTMSGLVKAKYVKMTEVQRCTIPHSLLGRDMMVCSRTGSGKTLSYLIPMVEKLYIVL